MTTKELAEFFGKTRQTIISKAKECNIIIENGKEKIYTKSEVEVIANKFYKNMPLAIKNSIDIAFPTCKNSIGTPNENLQVQILSVIEPFLKQQNEFNLMLIKELKEVKKPVKQIELKQDYFSIVGFCNKKKIPIVFSDAIKYGKEARKISEELNYEIRKVDDERFGKVNSYHIDVLSKVFSL